MLFGQQGDATPLQVASHEGHTDVVDTLLRKTDPTMVLNQFCYPFLDNVLSCTSVTELAVHM